MPKSPAMYLSILGLWVVWVALVDPRLTRLFLAAAGLAPKAALFAFGVCLNLFWLFGSYYLMLGLFTLIAARLKPLVPPPLGQPPSVAVLYTTMHDFQEEAALSCIQQTYVNAHLFILDDSLDAASKAEVDAFAAQHRGKVTVVRRPSRQGYKAGSLNYALRHHVQGFRYFAVADADSVLPPTFVADLVPYFGLGEDIGYVQGSHRPNERQKSQFAHDLCLGIVPLWTFYYGPRNRFGNVIFLGHGGMIRYDVWEKVGGFPELVSEDLALSTRAAQLGYRGYFVPQVISYEDFPEGYRQLRRQQEKYIKGACEYLHQEFWPYLRSPAVRWFEKLDVFLSCGSLFMPVLFLAFMFIYCAILPLFFCTWQQLTVGFAGRELVSLPVLALDRALHELWSWDFYVITVLCTFAPALGCLGLIFRYPWRALKMLPLSAVPYLSLMVVAAAALVSYLFSKKAVYLVTGDRWGADPAGWPRGYSPGLPLTSRLGSEDRWTRAAELVLGGILTVMCLVTANVSLLAFALATVLGSVLFRTRWESRLLRPMLYAPFLLICVGLAFAGMDAVLAQGSFMCAFAFHF